MLGRGRLQGPSKGIDALIHFVEQRLLPQDQVAVLAYNRATDFTTDRRPILEALARFKTANDSIESKLEHWYSGPPGNSEDRLPGHVQPLIDDVFAGPHATRFRHIPPGRIADARRLADGFEREAEKAEGVGIEAFDSYVSTALATRQDLGSIYTGIEICGSSTGRSADLHQHGWPFLRVSRTICRWPRWPATRGSRSTPFRRGALRRPAGAAITVGTVVAPHVGHQRHPQCVRVHRTGVRSLSVCKRGVGGHRPHDPDGYLLGYVPDDLLQDGAYRRIEVKVARKGATVLYRRG